MNMSVKLITVKLRDFCFCARDLTFNCIVCVVAAMVIVRVDVRATARDRLNLNRNTIKSTLAMANIVNGKNE